MWKKENALKTKSSLEKAYVDYNRISYSYLVGTLLCLHVFIMSLWQPSKKKKIGLHNLACLIALSQIKQIPPSLAMPYAYKIFNTFLVVFE